MGMGSQGFIVTLIFILIGIAIWYYLLRSSVRANEQIQLLKSIDSSLKSMLEKDDTHSAEPARKAITDDEALALERKKYGN